MMKDFFIYILKCSDGSYYVGHTDDIEKRISEHEQGFYEGYTSSRRPVRLVYIEPIGSRDETLQAERKLKGWLRKKILRLHHYVIPPFENTQESLRTNGSTFLLRDHNRSS